MTMFTWSTTANSNSTADASINWAEGQAPSTVNNSARAMMAAVAKYRNDTSGQINTGGSADAYTFTSAQTFSSLQDGITITFRVHASNTAASTINVDSLGTKPLRAFSGDALAGGFLVEGSIYSATYDSGDDEWLLHNPASPEGLSVVQTGTIAAYAGTTAPTGYLLCYGQAVSRTTYAALFAIASTTYGSGDGSTTFNIPDLRGRVVAGQDDMGGSSANRLTAQSGGLDGDTLGATGGAETHTLTTDEMPAHTHGVAGLGDGSGGGSRLFAGAGAGQQSGSTGGSAAHNNVQPTIILNYIIKT